MNETKEVDLTFWNRFKTLCREEGAAPNPIAKKIGISSGALTMWSRGGMPAVDKLIDIANYFSVSTDYLLGLAEEMRPYPRLVKKELPEEDYNRLDSYGKRLVKLVIAEELRRLGKVEEPKQELPRIRHYLTAAAAGYAAPVEGEDFELIEMPGDAPAGADFCIDIAGDSMEPFIHDGSRVYVSRSADLKEFDAGVFFLDGDVFCKQWCRGFDGGVYLLSANPAREDANIMLTKEIGRNLVCFGKVMGLPRLPKPVYMR